MANEKDVENKINLDCSVSEQIADMQLMYLRQAAFNRALSFDEIKTLEILTKVKNVEVDKRQVPSEDPEKTKSKKIKELAASAPANLLEINPKEKVENGSEKDSSSKS